MRNVRQPLLPIMMAVAGLLAGASVSPPAAEAAVRAECVPGEANSCFWSGANFTGTFEGITSTPGECNKFLTIPSAGSVSNVSDRYTLFVHENPDCTGRQPYLLPGTSSGDVGFLIQSFHLTYFP
ncbi:hypothetical protein [Nocardia arizonensis]|uniref:hypothetical protein n=1 Tax=Nocardia arizonensis TaxID=1141647 RepID=UPI000ACC5AE7|nr:hypothetical protein [Nocardia arizonensis]